MLLVSELYELVSFVNRGKIRKGTLIELRRPHTPTELADILMAHRSSVSRAVLALEKRGLVKCITPDEKVCRYYQISDEGSRVLAEIKNLEKKIE